MAGSTYSTNLKIELMTTGENSGTWGDITNTNLGTALEQAVVGYGNPDYVSDANLTISITNSNAAQPARALVLNVTSTFGSLTATRELVVPTIQKQYIVQNNTTGGQSITVKTSAGTGITVPNGRKAHLYVDGTNVIQMFDFVDINGGTIDGTPIGGSSAAAGAFTTLNASGATTLDGSVALGNASGDLITFPGTINSSLLFTDNTYDIGASGATRPRNLFLAGAATIGGNLSVGGTLTLTGGVNLNGNVTVGDSAADTLTINATITSNLIFTDNTYDIGASGATRPRNLFLAGNATIGGAQTLTGALTVDSTTNATSGVTGSIQTDGGIGVAKDIYVAGSTTLGDASADTVTVNGTITSNLLFTDNTYNIGAIGANRPANVYVAAGVTAGLGLIVSKSTSGAAPYLSLANASSDGGVGTRIYMTNDVAAAKYNWVMGTQIVTNDTLEFVPSTALGGGTYSNPTLTLYANGAATFRDGIFVKGGGSTFGNGTVVTGSAAEIALDSGTANKYSDIDYLHGGVLKWRVGTNGGDNLNVFRAGVGNVAIFNTSNDLTLINNLNFGVGKSITWDSNNFYLQTRSASVPVILLMQSATGGYPPRLDFNNGAGTDVVIRFDAGGSQSYINNGGGLSIGTATNYTGARLYVQNSINTNYDGTIGMRYNVSGQISNYYKGMTGTIPTSGGSARGLSLFNYDQDSDEGIMFWNGVPGSALWRGTLSSVGEFTIVGSMGLGRNSRTATTTGDFISSGGGNSSTYNGVAIESNSKSLTAQANTSLPSWILDIGGRAADGSTFNVNTANKFRVAYVAAGGTYYGASDLFSINSTGYSVFGVGQIADTANNGLIQIRGDTSGQFDALTIQNNNNNPSGQSVRMRWKTSAGGSAEAPKFGFIDYTAVSNYGEQGRFSIGVAQTYNVTPVPTAYIDGLGLRIKTTSQVEALTVSGNIAYSNGGNWNKIKSVQHNNVAQNTWYTIDSWGTYEATAFLLMISYEYDAGDGQNRFALFIPTGAAYAGGVTLTRLGGSTDIEIQMSGGTTLQMRQIFNGTATGILRATWIRIDGNG